MIIDFLTAGYKDYAGMGKKPADFDEFWDKAKAEVDRLPLEFELEKVDIPSQVAEFYYLRFKGVGGATVVCQLIKPLKKQKQHPGMLMFHGYHGDSGDFVDKLSWVAEGYIVMAMDCRGQGGLSEDVTVTNGTTLKGHIIRGVEEGPEKLYYRSVYLDTYHCAKILASLTDVDENQLVTSGGSQGGALALVCAALYPEIKKTLAIFPFLSDYRKLFQLDISVTATAYEELHYWFRQRDPLHQREAKFFDTLEYIDIQHLAARIKASVIWPIGLADVITPPATQFAVYNQLTCDKEMVIYPEYGHDHLPGLNDRVRAFLIP